MVFFRAALVIFLLVGSFVGITLYRMGIVDHPQVVGVQKKSIAQMLVRTKVGAYHKSVPDLLELKRALDKNKMEPSFCFAEFFDDPDVVEQKKLKSQIGCAFESPLEKIKSLSADVINEYHWSTWPQQEVLVLKWPTGPALGQIKVYPVANEWFASNHLTRAGNRVLEVYNFLVDDQKQETVYWFPIKK